ncbi:hypothetical protein MKK70_12015 [Methylobacterium sp. E-041]|uniref:hypothetical protein n=1 Tax=Methylobacterium sp. E-041 TaxID=2836573 RepID=UPI001FB8B1A3|nr:hypothetical protein [Methylobacterium sp. E-041]MCJ2106088.1 hypothetical protein [Methylobacterium sp. E-041]
MRTFLLALLAAGLAAAPAQAQVSPPAPAAPAPVPAPAPEPALPTPAADLAVLQPCGARAARFEGAKGFDVVVTRIGRASIANPLRPLTPETSQVLQVVIAAKPATAYGPDLTALRRGPAPAALETQLGAPIRWENGLPDLPDPLPIVAEDGTPLAALAFRACIDPPAVAAPPVVARGTKGNGQGASKGAGRGNAKGNAKGNALEAGPADGAPDPSGAGQEPAKAAARRPAKPAPRKDAAPKAPPGFHVPQGAIAE